MKRCARLSAVFSDQLHQQSWSRNRESIAQESPPVCSPAGFCFLKKTAPALHTRAVSGPVPPQRGRDPQIYVGMNISNGPVRLRDWQPEGDHNFLHSNIGDLYMRKPAMTPVAVPHRGTAAPFRVAIGLALAAGAGTMLWGVGTHSLAFASEFGRNAARETPMTLEDRVAALTGELAQVKAETAKLRESQGDTSEDLSHIRASLANSEIGLAALRTTTDENEARRARYGCPDRVESRPAEGRDAPPPLGAGRYRNRARLAARRRGEQRDRRRRAPRDHGRDPPADPAHRGC